MNASDVPSTPPGEGYVLYRGPVSVALGSLATSLLSGDMGTVSHFEYENGLPGLARVEPHPPAPERGLTSWHKGITLYVNESPKPSGAHLNAGLVVVAMLGAGWLVSRW